MNITDLCLRRPVFAWMLMLGTMLFGLLAITRIGVSQFPDVNNPTVNRETLTVGINAFVGLYQTQYQYLFVASIIGIVPVVVLFAFIEKFLVGGLTAGSIK